MEVIDEHRLVCWFHHEHQTGAELARQVKVVLKPDALAVSGDTYDGNLSSHQ
jgi:hypothetical protein